VCVCVSHYIDQTVVLHVSRTFEIRAKFILILKLIIYVINYLRYERVKFFDRDLRPSISTTRSVRSVFARICRSRPSLRISYRPAAAIFFPTLVFIFQTFGRQIIRLIKHEKKKNQSETFWTFSGRVSVFRHTDELLKQTEARHNFNAKSVVGNTNWRRKPTYFIVVYGVGKPEAKSPERHAAPWNRRLPSHALGRTCRAGASVFAARARGTATVVRKPGFFARGHAFPYENVTCFFFFPDDTLRIYLPVRMHHEHSRGVHTTVTHFPKRM